MIELNPLIKLWSGENKTTKEREKFKYWPPDPCHRLDILPYAQPSVELFY